MTKLLRLVVVMIGALALMALAHPASAGTICPTFVGNPISGTTGCDVVFTIGTGGSVTVTFPSTVAYEFSEDQLVGIINNSGSAITSLSISGPSADDLFGFDFDGVCDGDYITITGCGSGTPSSDVSGYAPAGYVFGAVTTSGGIDTALLTFPSIAGNGGTGFFSLEGAPSAAGGIGGSVGGTGVPEPSSFLLTGIGLFCLLGLTFFRRPNVSQVA